jgi:glycosyltransferase involved in cell wall biosynthesis
VIRVCHIITGLYTGGAETMLYQLLSGTDRRSFEPSVISLVDRGTLGERIEALGVPVHTLGMPRGRPTPAGLLRFRRLLRELRPDLLQGWMYHGNLAASLGMRLAPHRPPHLWGIHHSLHDFGAERAGLRALIRLCRRVSGSPAAAVYVSRASAAQHQAFGFRHRALRIIPNGFDGKAYRPDPALRQAVRAELGASPGEVLVGHIARYHPMKDHGNLLRAARSLIDSGRELRLVLAGPGVDTANRELRGMIDSLSLGERVVFLGERRDIPALLAGLDVYCMSSSHGEAFPMAVGEAMAAGLPCVVTDVGDAAWLVGDTGRVVPARDSAALATALEALLDCGSEDRRRLGAAARQRVLERFSLEAVVGEYQALYRELVSELPI